MNGQNAPRKDVDSADFLMSFDSEEPGLQSEQPRMRTEEPAMRLDEPRMHSKEPRMRSEEPAMHSEEPPLHSEERIRTKEPAMPLGEPRLLSEEPRMRSQEPRMRSEAPDSRSPGHVLFMRSPYDLPHLMSGAVPVVRRRKTRRNIGIALLVLGGVGLAFSSRLLVGMSGDQGASAPPTQNVLQPTPDVPQAVQDAPQAVPNVPPPAPSDLPRPTPADPPLPALSDLQRPIPADPPPPARTDAPAPTASTVGAPTTRVPVAPTRAPAAPDTAASVAPVERPTRQARSQPFATSANAPGGLFAITRPVGAQVYLDGRLVGTTPMFMSGLSPGSRQVRLELPGFQTYSSTIRIVPNERYRLAVQLVE